MPRNYLAPIHYKQVIFNQSKIKQQTDFTLSFVQLVVASSSEFDKVMIFENEWEKQYLVTGGGAFVGRRNRGDNGASGITLCEQHWTQYRTFEHKWKQMWFVQAEVGWLRSLHANEAIAIVMRRASSYLHHHRYELHRSVFFLFRQNTIKHTQSQRTKKILWKQNKTTRDNWRETCYLSTWWHWR